MFSGAISSTCRDVETRQQVIRFTCRIIEKNSVSNCLPIIMSKLVDSYGQAYSQLSTSLLIIIGNRFYIERKKGKTLIINYINTENIYLQL